MEEFVMPTAEEMEASRLQMCQQGAGGPGAKAEDGKLVTRRKAAQYKRSRAARGSKGNSKLVTPAPAGTDMRTSAQRKADHFAKKSAGLARVKKGQISRPISRGKTSRLPQLAAAPAKKTRAKKSTTAAAKKPAAKKSTGGRKKAAAANPFDASGI